jgi:hypothetical protein
VSGCLVCFGVAVVLYDVDGFGRGAGGDEDFAVTLLATVVGCEFYAKGVLSLGGA